jgi:hypothetical protein
VCVCVCVCVCMCVYVCVCVYRGGMCVRVWFMLRGRESRRASKSREGKDTVDALRSSLLLILPLHPAATTLHHPTPHACMAIIPAISPNPPTHSTTTQKNNPNPTATTTTNHKVGCMLVDGLGDGVMFEGPFDLSFLRTTSFATLQVRSYVIRRIIS